MSKQESWSAKVNRKLNKKLQVIDVAAGRRKADLVLKNATYVNVFSGELDTGDISEVIALDGWQCLIRCRQRTEHQYVPLEDVESIVIQSIRESRYDALIAERMENIQIRGDLERLYRFTAEQLR